MASTDQTGSASEQTSVEVWLESDDAAPGSARAMVEEFGDSLSGSTYQDAELVASELVANAAEHGDGDGLRLRVRRTGATGLEVSVFNRLRSRSSGVPERPWRMPALDAIRGRGLAIVAALSTSVAVDRTDSAVEVTATVVT